MNGGFSAPSSGREAKIHECLPTMNATLSPQSNVASLPPPETLVAGLLRNNPLGSSRLDFRLPRHALTFPTVVPRFTPNAVGLCLSDSLRSRWESYAEQHRRFQEEFSEETVHELRVASRRLTVQCDLLKSVAPSAAVDKARWILKRRLKALSALRNVQVQRNFVERHLTAFPELVLVRDFLERRERRLAKVAAAKLRGFKLGKLERWIFAMLRAIADKTSNLKSRDRLCWAIFRIGQNAYAEVVRRRRAIDLNDLSTIHRTRVGFKRFRYVIEALSPSITGFNRRQLRALAGYQRKMGVVQDLEIMQCCMATFVQKHQAAEHPLRPFCKYLEQRRIRAVCSFAQSADKLFEFWPTDWPNSEPDFDFARNAA